MDGVMGEEDGTELLLSRRGCRCGGTTVTSEVIRGFYVQKRETGQSMVV